MFGKVKSIVENAMKEVELDVFDGHSINLDTFKVHDSLCREIWDSENRLRPEIRDSLLDIACEFMDKVDLEGIADLPPGSPEIVKDIILLGSLASYNYSKYADFDLHIVIDLAPLNLDEKTEELFKRYFNDCRNNWNSTHGSLTVRGFDVEVYMQDCHEQNAANGVYSVLEDRWVKFPERMDSFSYDEDVVKSESIKYIGWIDFLQSTLDGGGDAGEVLEVAALVKNRLIRSRRHSLELAGNEMTEANLVFKVLRRAGYIGKLNGIIDRAYDAWMSVVETGK